MIAVGTETARPPEIAFDSESIIDSDGLLTLKQLPTSLTIVGGGVIGCEYASILATLGIPVVLVERRSRLLEFVDSELIEALQYQMRSIGVTLRFNEEVVRIEKSQDNSVAIHLKSGKKICAPLLMYSIGRVGATVGLNLERIAIQPDERGRLKVNENFQDLHPAHLRRRRCRRLPRPRLDIYATRTARLLSCLRPRLRDVIPSFALWHLYDPGNLHGGTQ